MIDYRNFIEQNFYIFNEEGELVPFIFNDVQSDYYDLLTKDYPTKQGIRENILKSRRMGFSSFWAAIFTTDFIFSANNKINMINTDIYSVKDKDTKSHMDRINVFIDSWLIKDQGGDYTNQEHRKEVPKLRKAFLKLDADGYLEAQNGANIQSQTASAKVSGRGGTKSNILWTEVAFYGDTSILNAEDLLTGAEPQVKDGYGKIVRETTGNLSNNYFAQEWRGGKDGLTEFKSRFIAWYSERSNKVTPPEDWERPEYYDKLVESGDATEEQCYWHYQKTRGLKDKKKLREYPTYPIEAFLAGGSQFFDPDALLHYINNVQEPVKTVEYAGGLLV